MIQYIIFSIQKKSEQNKTKLNLNTHLANFNKCLFNIFIFKLFAIQFSS